MIYFMQPVNLCILAGLYWMGEGHGKTGERKGRGGRAG